MSSPQRDIAAPDLGLSEPVILSRWFIAPGKQVAEGEPLLELVAGEALVQLSAEVSGVLVQHRAGGLVVAGELLGAIEPAADESSTPGFP